MKHFSFFLVWAKWCDTSFETSWWPLPPLCRDFGRSYSEPCGEPIDPRFIHLSLSIITICSWVLKARWKFGDQVLIFNLCCFQGQLAPFPMATCQPLTSSAAKRAKLQTTMFLPLETRKVLGDNAVILSPKPRHRGSVAPYSIHTDNHSTWT